MPDLSLDDIQYIASQTYIYVTYCIYRYYNFVVALRKSVILPFKYVILPFKSVILPFKLEILPKFVIECIITCLVAPLFLPYNQRVHNGDTQIVAAARVTRKRFKLNSESSRIRTLPICWTTWRRC